MTKKPGREYYQGEQRLDVVGREIVSDAQDAAVIKRERTRKLDAIKERLVGAPARFFDGKTTTSAKIEFPNKPEAEPETEDAEPWYRIFNRTRRRPKGKVRFPKQDK